MTTRSSSGSHSRTPRRHQQRLITLRKQEILQHNHDLNRQVSTYEGAPFMRQADSCRFDQPTWRRYRGMSAFPAGQVAA
jgi:hypothetical protein